MVRFRPSLVLAFIASLLAAGLVHAGEEKLPPPSISSAASDHFVRSPAAPLLPKVQAVPSSQSPILPMCCGYFSWKETTSEDRIRADAWCYYLQAFCGETVGRDPYAIELAPSTSERKELLEKAVVSAKCALECKEDALICKMLAISYSDLGRYALALDAVDRALKLEPDEGLNLKGEILVRKGDFDAALACFERARKRELHASQKRILTNVARMNVRFKRYDAANDALDECFGISAEFAESYALRAEIISRTNNDKGQRKALFDYLLNKYRQAMRRPNAYGFLNEPPQEPTNPADAKLKARLDSLLSGSPEDEPPLAHLIL